ncbi:hypothetical protein VKT23_011894 [Stygiomarasmius scandens]|uniref:Uncharacterized protein n=1 Tax=Marasmiellus scandens TaxID=2682957 RepID=A0ABR1JBV8_9AGAR
MGIYGEAQPEDVYADAAILNCDTPARKMNGMAGHSHGIHPCPYCDVTLIDINSAKGYSFSTFKSFASIHFRPHLSITIDWNQKDDFEQLKQAFASKDAHPQQQEYILNSSSMATHQSLKKADEWRHILTITPVLLWFAWKDHRDEIPNRTPPIPSNAKKIPQHNRNMQQIYELSLLLCLTARLLCCHEISINQAKEGQELRGRIYEDSSLLNSSHLAGQV